MYILCANLLYIKEPCTLFFFLKVVKWCKEKKLSFTKTEEVGKRALQAIRKNIPLLFHWRGGYLTREVLAELIDVLEKAAEQKGRHAAVSLNWPQAVLQVSFPERLPEEAFAVENANEGEEVQD